jgi:hypothetical protein
MISKARCTGKLAQHLVGVLEAEPNEYPGESTARSRGEAALDRPNPHLERIKGRSF